MAVDSYRQALSSVQRKPAMRNCRTYRTVSFEAAAVLASTIPIDPMALERRNVYRMGTPTHVGWTRTLISDLREWIKRKHGEMDFYLTQAMTGHGVFKAYNYKIRKTRDDICMYCEQRDNAENSMFHCIKWEEDRRTVNDSLNTDLNKDNMVRYMLACQVTWNPSSNR